MWNIYGCIEVIDKISYQLPNSVKNHIDKFFANSVVTTSVVVGGIFFACNELFWMEKLTVCAGADFIWCIKQQQQQQQQVKETND